MTPVDERGKGVARWLSRRRLLRLGLAAAALALALVGFSGLGAWLVVADPLQPARAVAVLAGQVPFRAMEAAAIYRQGLVPEVWLTRNEPSAEDAALSRLGIDRPGDYVYSQQVLVRLGVPQSAIHVLAPRTVNTAEEVSAIAIQLDALGAKRVIVVTSKYHTRRVRLLWRSLAGTQLELLVRYASQDPFEPDRWWRSTPDAISVTRECFGLVNALAGFPIRSKRR